MLMRNPEFSFKGKFGGSFASALQTIGTVSLLQFFWITVIILSNSLENRPRFTIFHVWEFSGRFLISSFLSHLYPPLVLKPRQGTISSLKTLSASSSSSMASESVYQDSESDSISDPLVAGKSESSSSASAALAIIISTACSAENLFCLKQRKNPSKRQREFIQQYFKLKSLQNVFLK